MNVKKLILLPLITLIVSCKPQTSSNSKIDYGIMERQSVTWAECLSQTESNYLVFFYSETCSSCREIKRDVVVFATSNVVKTYFLDVAKPINNVQTCPEDEIVVGVDNIEDLYIVATPTFIEVENGRTTVNVVGKERCLGLLETLQNSQN